MGKRATTARHSTGIQRLRPFYCKPDSHFVSLHRTPRPSPICSTVPRFLNERMRARACSPIAFRRAASAASKPFASMMRPAIASVVNGAPSAAFSRRPCRAETTHFGRSIAFAAHRCASRQHFPIHARPRARGRRKSKTVAGGQGRALADRSADPVCEKRAHPHGRSDRRDSRQHQGVGLDEPGRWWARTVA
jgi:hypothetical protein